MPHFVYMLRCAGNRIYTGYAVDVEARFEQHKSGKGAKFTKAFPPECILRKFELPSHEQALRLEARIKKLTREQKELLSSPAEREQVMLRIRYDFDQDKAWLGYSWDGAVWTELTEPLQMRFTLDYFTGYRSALYCYATRELGGYADFDWFHQE